MTDQNKNKHMKIIDVEAIDDADDAAGGPVDTVDIFDDLANGSHSAERKRNKSLEDVENPLSDEDKDVVEENLYSSEPDSDEAE